ncbi:MAG: peptidoglycan-binding domain-containing protein, partial [Acidimicrobiia bacterium]
MAWVDNRPIVLLYGELPAWRSMARNDDGPDVQQLETALTDLGFNEDEALMTVDESYTSATKGVVETWQESVGADDDGVVDFGEVMFLPGPVRVDSLQVAVGDQVSPGSPIFTTSSDDTEITFGLP